MHGPALSGSGFGCSVPGAEDFAPKAKRPSYIFKGAHMQDGASKKRICFAAPLAGNDSPASKRTCRTQTHGPDASAAEGHLLRHLDFPCPDPLSACSVLRSSSEESPTSCASPVSKEASKHRRAGNDHSKRNRVESVVQEQQAGMHGSPCTADSQSVPASWMDLLIQAICVNTRKGVAPYKELIQRAVVAASESVADPDLPRRINAAAFKPLPRTGKWTSCSPSCHQEALRHLLAVEAERARCNSAPCSPEESNRMHSFADMFWGPRSETPFDIEKSEGLRYPRTMTMSRTHESATVLQEGAFVKAMLGSSRTSLSVSGGTETERARSSSMQIYPGEPSSMHSFAGESLGLSSELPFCEEEKEGQRHCRTKSASVNQEADTVEAAFPRSAFSGSSEARLPASGKTDGTLGNQKLRAILPKHELTLLEISPEDLEDGGFVRAAPQDEDVDMELFTVRAALGSGLLDTSQLKLLEVIGDSDL
eukprot:TRINITY_DN72419_c0_g1_i1.p1 TRINITY_DN72419_c0_g1~~TRINITY_DN72419_c0_g1_i1.p1  ORF type:complete len:500 (-),score=50.80 TRINITY_DN72419_c0_g1_i1:160-1599(-)